MDVGIPWSSSSSSSGACGSSLARPLLTGQGLSTGAVRVVQIDSTASASARERDRQRATEIEPAAKVAAVPTCWTCIAHTHVATALPSTANTPHASSSAS
jgi:hypothetical protein